MGCAPEVTTGAAAAAASNSKLRENSPKLSPKSLSAQTPVAAQDPSTATPPVLASPNRCAPEVTTGAAAAAASNSKLRENSPKLSPKSLSAQTPVAAQDP